MDNAEVSFPVLVEFTKSSEEKREKVFQIINRRNVNVGGRQSIILTLKGEDRNIQDVRASSLIVAKIQQNKDSWIDKQVFIIRRGKK